MNSFRPTEKALLTLIVCHLKMSQEESTFWLCMYFTLCTREYGNLSLRDIVTFSPSLFKHAMKSAADCPYVTVFKMQVSR